MSQGKQYPFEFSVVMAVYNVEPFLREAVDSLIGQDFGFEKIQLIMVDDGSTDGSGAICDEYAAQYPDNVIVVHKENGGVASARNEGLKYATGHYLNFMDSDDYFTQNTFAEVYKFLIKNDEEVDVATVPLYFFDAQTGEHWQNSKFKKGTRVIDLYWEYQSTLMFVNASFFHNRIKKDILFDHHLVCGEDMKVLLSVLIQKMKLGVVTGCKYMYRRRNAGEASLIQSAKKKRGWYFDYFTYLIDWAVDYYRDTLGYLPSFLQYELLCDIQWRYREIYDMSDILTEEEVLQYKERVAQSLRYFEDKYILEQKMLWDEHKCYMLSQKYAQPPTVTQRKSNVIIHFGNTLFKSLSDQYSVIEFISVRADSMSVEGYTKVMGIPQEEPLEVFLDVNGELYLCDILSRTDINEYRFGDLIYRGVQFSGKVPLSERENNYRIKLVVKYKDCYVEKRDIRYGKFSPITKEYQHAYFCNEGWAVQAVHNEISVFRCDWKRRTLLEGQFLLELWRKKTAASRKAVFSRIAYHLLKTFKQHEIWLVSDRSYAAGDNGESFFEFLVQNSDKKRKVFFVLSKESDDLCRLKKIGSVLPYLSWRHKMAHLLASYVVSSHADELVYNPFGMYIAPYRNLMQRVKFVFLQHGVTGSDASFWFNRHRINAQGFVTAAYPECRSIQKEEYGYSRSAVWLTGFPRFDKLYQNEQKRITIMPTWRAYLVENDTATGIRKPKAGFEKSAYFAMYTQLLQNKRLIQGAEKYGYSIRFVNHPNMLGTEQYFEFDTNIKLEKEKPYHQIFAESDLLITDYSSVAFDFAYLRKPLIYFQSDIQDFFSGAHTVQKGYFDYECDGFGEVEYDLDGIVDRIIEYMENGCQLKDKYRERIDNFFAFNDRNNCQRVYEKILELDK